MRAQFTMLRYWKSEHSEETCEDACGAKIAQGLFVIADGAGTTLFSDVWASFLVDYFLRVPLMSNDPFEVEWWLRMAQEQFKRDAPQVNTVEWNALQKVQEQGSYSTLATLRVANSSAAQLTAALLTFGDSCILVSRAVSQQVFSFPLQQAEEFEQDPICVPSRLNLFNRYFHRCRVASLDLVPNDIAIIATDAVARWIISGGDDDPQHAFRLVAQQVPNSWPAFIQACRASGRMVDDDSTALVISLLPDTADEGIELNATTQHSQQVREARKAAFLQARQEHNKERMAICWGDGIDLKEEGIGLPLETVQELRTVADAQRAVLAALRQELNNPRVIEIMTPIWQRYASLLYDEPCAENLRKTLARLGVPLSVGAGVAVSRGGDPLGRPPRGEDKPAGFVVPQAGDPEGLHDGENRSVGFVVPTEGDPEGPLPTSSATPAPTGDKDLETQQFTLSKERLASITQDTRGEGTEDA